MSMDSRIANKDKTILSLQLEELEPVFMGEEEDKGIHAYSNLLHFPFFTFCTSDTVKIRLVTMLMCNKSE